MPYYLFSIRSFGRIEKRGEHSGFREASAAAKLMRFDKKLSVEVTVCTFHLFQSAQPPLGKVVQAG